MHSVLVGDLGRDVTMRTQCRDGILQSDAVEAQRAVGVKLSSVSLVPRRVMHRPSDDANHTHMVVLANWPNMALSPSQGRAWHVPRRVLGKHAAQRVDGGPEGVVADDEGTLPTRARPA